jgi:hypothetical protein
MGAEYIESVREKFKNEESGFTNETEATGTDTTSGSGPRESGSNTSRLNKQTTSGSGVSGGVKKRSTSPRSLNSRLDTYIIRKILDNNILTRDSIKQSFDMKLSSMVVPENAGPNNAPYADDFKSPIELALFAYDLDKARRTRADLIGSISDLILCNLPDRLNAGNLREFIWIKYGIYPAHVRLVFERGHLLGGLQKKFL